MDWQTLSLAVGGGAEMDELEVRLNETSMAEVLELASGILENLSRNQQLRTPMYRAELRLKSAAWAGRPIDQLRGGDGAICASNCTYQACPRRLVR